MDRRDAVKTVTRKKRRIFKISSQDNIYGYIFILPWLLGLLAFQVWPILYSLFISFCDFDLFSSPDFIGLANYTEMMKDEYFWKSLNNTVIYVLYTVPLKLAFALIIAVILNQNIKRIELYRTLYYVPSVIGSSVAISIMWMALFEKYGVVNSMLSVIGIKGPAWLGSPDISLFTVGLLTVWQFGSSMVIFLAGLKQIPSELYEAASIDGSSTLGKFFTITLPLLTPMIFFNLLMQVIIAFQTFAAPFIIYHGGFGPVNSCLLLVMYIYKHGFQLFNMGYASALSWILLVLAGAFAAILFKTQNKWVYYSS